MAMRPEPRESHVASPAIKKLMAKHGIGGMECKGRMCSFKREGQIVKVRL
jgi:hypothetical protein